MNEIYKQLIGLTEEQAKKWVNNNLRQVYFNQTVNSFITKDRSKFIEQFKLMAGKSVAKFLIEENLFCIENRKDDLRGNEIFTYSIVVLNNDY